MDDLPFDLDTAIRVCRQAGFFEHASYLARKYGRHEEFLRVQIEDAEEYGDALKYLRGLGPKAVSSFRRVRFKIDLLIDQCQENLITYGRTLLQHVPEETTNLLIDLCSGTLGKTPAPSQSNDDPAKGKTSGGPDVLSYLGYNRVAGMFTSEPQSSSPVTTEAPNSAQINGDRSGSRITQKSGKTGTDPSTKREATDMTIDGTIDAGPSYTPPSPQQYFAHFIDHHDLFIHFLESVALTLWNQKVDTPSTATPAAPPTYTETAPVASSDPIRGDQRAVWNTLLELYLGSTSSSDQTVAGLAKRKVLGLLGSQLPVDSMHALLLCSTAGFTEGMVRLWENMGMYEDVLRFWMSAPSPSADGAPHPSDEVLRCLQLYGPTNPHLYPLVLRYLTSSPEVLSRQAGQLGRILEQIDEGRIMPPLAVVQLLSRNGVASVGNVKEWLKAKVAETRQDVESVCHSKSLHKNERKLIYLGQIFGAILPNRNCPKIHPNNLTSQSLPTRDLPSHPLCLVLTTTRPPRSSLYV